MKMERIEQSSPGGAVTFEIADDIGGSIILSPAMAYELLDWLDDQRAELHQAATQGNDPERDTGEQESL
jgi:hypothetical protein